MPRKNKPRHRRRRRKSGPHPSGRYQNNALNRRLGRVGLYYSKGNGEGEGDFPDSWLYNYQMFGGMLTGLASGSVPPPPVPPRRLPPNELKKLHLLEQQKYKYAWETFHSAMRAYQKKYGDPGHSKRIQQRLTAGPPQLRRPPSSAADPFADFDWEPTVPEQIYGRLPPLAPEESPYQPLPPGTQIPRHVLEARKAAATKRAKGEWVAARPYGNRSSPHILKR